MRKVELFVLFLKSLTLNFFLVVPAIAEDFTKKSENIVLAQLAPQYYIVPAAPIVYDSGFVENDNVQIQRNDIVNAPNLPVYSDIDLGDAERFPEPSVSYQPPSNRYWY